MLDTDGATVTTENASDIINSVPATPVVITPDTAFSIPWRGAMVYVNDLEGKITKFNLTSQSTAKMFDQTTLFRLDANMTTLGTLILAWMQELELKMVNSIFLVVQETFQILEEEKKIWITLCMG